MASLDQLEAWRDALLAARASNRKRVETPDYAVTYRSDEELDRAIKDVERRIEAASAPAGRGPIRVTTSKGV